MKDTNVRRYAATDEQPLSREETRRRHKKRARRLMFRRFAVLILLFVGIWYVWRNWDTLAPDKLYANLQDFISDSSGAYPVDISGSEGKALVRSQNYTVLLDDSYLTYYNDNGGEVTRYSCTYTTPLVRTAGKYVLVAEQGGKRLLLTTRSLQLASMALEQKILAVDVNKKGQMAVLTQGAPGYAVGLTVYDQKGKLLYSRSRTSLANEVALSADGKLVALLSVDTVGGALNTTMEVFSLSSTETAAKCTFTAPDTLLYRLAFLSNSCILAVGENGALLFPVSGDSPTSYTVGGQQMLGYAVANNTAAVVTHTMGDTAGGNVTVLSAEGKELCRVPFTGEFRHLSAVGGQYLLLTDSRAQVIGHTGAGKAAAVAADGQQAVLAGNRAIVLGISKLQEYVLE